MNKKHYLTESKIRSIIKMVIDEQSMGGMATPQNYAQYSTKAVEDGIKTPVIEKFNNLRSAMSYVEYQTTKVYFKQNKNCDATCVADKQDAMRHMATSAYATTLFNRPIAWILGQIQEIYGGLRLFLRGSPTNPRFTSFDSNWLMDTYNNNIGLQLAKDYPNKTIDEYITLSKKNVESGNYYNRNKVYMKNVRQ